MASSSPISIHKAGPDIRGGHATSSSPLPSAGASGPTTWFPSFDLATVVSSLGVPLDSPWVHGIVMLRSPSSTPLSADDISSNRLNTHFRFVDAFPDFLSLLSVHPYRDPRKFIVMSQSLQAMTLTFNYFQVKGIRSVFEACGVHLPTNVTKSRLETRLTNLRSPLKPVLFLFESMLKPRLLPLPLKPVHPDHRPADAERKRKARETEDSEIKRVRHEQDAASHRRKYDAIRQAERANIQDVAANFPRPCSVDLQHQIIADFQHTVHPSQFTRHPCAVCQAVCFGDDYHVVPDDKVDFSLLCNPSIPADLLPTAYNLDLYGNAILYPPGMSSLDSLGPLNMCNTCYSSLIESKLPSLPEFALANFYYYAVDCLPKEVKTSFENASPSDLMMVALARASRITYRFTADPAKGLHLDPSTAQGYSKGNTIILPQDPSGVRKLLPPSSTEINQSICALFVGKTKPSAENIAQLSPVMVSKSIVQTLIMFLLDENPYYRASGAQFSLDNLNNLFSADSASQDRALPRAMEVAFATLDEAVRSATADYTDRYEGVDFLSSDSSTPEIFMESVGYTDGDHSPQNYLHMKAEALSWCRSGKTFIKYQSGSLPLSDRDESFLTAVFPHLDPWGLGALNHPRRKSKTSLLRQLQHLIRIDKSPFEMDANFTYICWNIISKAEVNKTLSFRVKEKHRQRVVRDIQSIESKTFLDLAKRLEADPFCKPVNSQEKKALAILRSLRHVSAHMKGSAGSKIHLRNEIRALMNLKGTPALFVTLNPADVHHPLVRVLAGNDPDALPQLENGESLKKWQARLVAKRPAAAAMFFDTIIKSFINNVLRFGKGEGLFGIVEAYYGTVEAQGKGTLHLHLLIWIEGNLNPQALRDRMAADPDYQTRMINWLEENIRTTFPDAVSITEDKTVMKPSRPKDVPHPSSVLAPQLVDYKGDLEKFDRDFLQYTKEVVTECNWHMHTDTCWKKLNTKEKHDDAHCRLGMDGTTRFSTEIDEETGSIILRRWHPRINNYQIIVIGLIGGNMDIKYIGSGEGAKATLYYVTDYITKTVLPLHIGLAALTYAIQMYDEKFSNDTTSDCKTREKSLLVKSVNAMMSKTELSHQQVMSFIVGGGDHYTSHSFQVLYWGSFDRYFHKLQNGLSLSDSGDAPTNSSSNDSHADYDDNSNENDFDDGDDTQKESEVVLSIGDEAVTASNQIYDYRLRPADMAFDSLSLWESVEWTVKISRPADESRQAKRLPNTAGRKPLLRGLFSGEGEDIHPQVDSHILRKRDSPVVPILLGPTIARPDRGPVQREEWCRAMLILFKPWRRPEDLKDIGQSWCDAFDHYSFPQHLKDIMHNMNIQHECKDARDKYNSLRRAGKVPDIALPSLNSALTELHEEGIGGNLESALLGDETLDVDSDCEEEVQPRPKPDESDVDKDIRSAVQILKSAPQAINTPPALPDGCTAFSEVNGKDLEAIEVFTRQMKDLKQAGKPKPTHSDTEEEQDPHSLPGHGLSSPAVTTEVLGEYTAHNYTIRIGEFAAEDPLQAIESIIDESGLRGNDEQERAFRLIAEHFVKGKKEQMLMYLGGVGGTGKSYVIGAVVKLFQRCGQSQSLLLSAPTGIAAVLINGYTIHSLTLLPKSSHRTDVKSLNEIWAWIQWLVLDEISMVSAKLLSQISHQISIARGTDLGSAGKPFGGVNVVFSGDFGQLRPVRQKPVFSHELVKRVSIKTAQSIEGQTSLHGAHLWRLVNYHVELTKNWRHHTDSKYSNLLARLRLGKAWQGVFRHSQDQLGSGENYTISDYRVLMSRSLEHLRRVPRALDGFDDAPFIVTKKRIRDHLNDIRVQQYAAKTSQTVEYFVANDYVGKRKVSTIEKSRLLRVGSSKTNDALGRLPLVPGMRVMITENLALSESIVNGAEGVLQSVKFRLLQDGTKVAICAFVKLPSSNTCIHPDLGPGVFPIIPTRSTFKYSSATEGDFSITRWQLPLLPAYAYTDYKSQGRSLDKAIVDLAECYTLQSLYVILSRVRSLEGLAILRWFKPNKMHESLQAEFRNEFARLKLLNEETRVQFLARTPITLGDVDRRVLRGFKRSAELEDQSKSSSSTEIRSIATHISIDSVLEHTQR